MFLSVNIKYPFDSALYLPVNAHITAICAFQTVILRNMEKSKDLILMVSLKLFFYYWAFSSQQSSERTMA